MALVAKNDVELTDDVVESGLVWLADLREHRHFHAVALIGLVQQVFEADGVVSENSDLRTSLSDNALDLLGLFRKSHLVPFGLQTGR